MLEKMRRLVEEFRITQQQVEDISHTPENIPAFNMLQTDAAPRASRILDAITTIINEEAKLEATPERKELLKLLADSRGSFAVGLANIRAYLLSGDTKFAKNFETKWKINQDRFDKISGMTGLFDTAQARAWDTYRKILKEFVPLPPRMFKLRAGKDWNLANYWLGSRAAPKASAIMDILKEMRSSQDKLAQADQEKLKAEALFMKSMMVIGTLLALGLGM